MTISLLFLAIAYMNYAKWKKKNYRKDFFFRTVKGFYKQNYLYFQIQTDLKRLKKEPLKAIKVLKTEDRLFMVGSIAVRWTGRWSPPVVSIRGSSVKRELGCTPGLWQYTLQHSILKFFFIKHDRIFISLKNLSQT